VKNRGRSGKKRFRLHLNFKESPIRVSFFKRGRGLGDLSCAQGKAISVEKRRFGCSNEGKKGHWLTAERKEKSPLQVAKREQCISGVEKGKKKNPWLCGKGKGGRAESVRGKASAHIKKGPRR